MDPYIDLGHTQAPLSAIRHDTQSRVKFLAPLYRSGAPARCLCSETPVEMGVTRRNHPRPVFYLYHLHRGDPLLHEINCPHRVEQDDQAGQEPISTDKNAGLSLERDVASLVVHTPLLEPRRIDSGQPDAITGLPALLETVLHTAGLNAWHPGFISHRSYKQARFRIVEASKRIRPFGSFTLADIMFFPQVWDQAKRDDLEFEWQCFLDQLQPTPEQVPRGVVVGRLRSIAFKPGWSAPMLKLAEWKEPFWLDGCRNLLPVEAVTEEFSWLVMLAVESQPTGAKLRVVDGAAIRVTPQWLPVYSAVHAEFANFLVQDRMSFSTSLHTDQATAWAVPDFVVPERGADRARRIFPRRR
jgi:hypothetical protein